VARGERLALATVVATRRSAPRPVGAKLIVSESGELHVSVSGGCVESDVAVQAAEVIAGGEARLLSYGITDDQAWEESYVLFFSVLTERYKKRYPSVK